MNNLKDLISQEDAIVFVGSGVSRWAGLPSWEGMIEELAVYLERKGYDPSLVRQEAIDGDLLQAASYGLGQLTKPQFAEFIRLSSRSGTASPQPIHEAIMNLGPSCFITTNFDDLLEQAYRRSRPAPAEPRVVTNRQLTEQADIVHAQAREFIFKPHGDARDAESIVLAREQYRELYPGGTRNATLETLKTLLPSRPVLYVGFGLRDPDFLYIRDLLANLYRGGTRDHYAIVPDPAPQQIEYFRAHFGVHLVGYVTQPRSDGGRDHSRLLDLLVALDRSNSGAATGPQALNLTDPAAVLELARYAASNLVSQLGDIFSIHVAPRSEAINHFGRTNPYYYWPVCRFLLEGPARAVLIGAPGAGKSFAIQGAVNTLASNLQDACLQNRLTGEIVVPVSIDLKLYQGDLRSQIAARFPPNLGLNSLTGIFPVKLFLDGYNELPREYREDGSFDRQLDTLLADFPGVGVLVGSRTPDGLDRLDLPIVELSEVSAIEVQRRLPDAISQVPIEYRGDIIAILQRPFYFRLLNVSANLLEAVRTPADLYGRYIDHVRLGFEEHFGAHVGLIGALEKLAYSALEQGAEAFGLDRFRTNLATMAPEVDLGIIESMINWLASIDLIIPLPGGRGAFVHQSITEYLAARELARRLEKEDDVAELIALRRWDNAIYLTLSMLDGPLAGRVLQQIVTSDLRFALEGVRHVEEGREALVDKLLRTIIQVYPDLRRDFDLRSAFRRLPLIAANEPSLREIEREVAPLRDAAVWGLGQILGAAYKPELISMLFDAEEPPGYYEMSTLASLLEDDDIRGLIDRALLLDSATISNDESDTSRRIGALATALGEFPPAVIRRETIERFPNLDLQQRRLLATLVCDIFRNSKSEDGLSIVIELLRNRLAESTFSLYLIVRFEHSLRSSFLKVCDDALLQVIVSYVENGDAWGVQLLRTICPLDSDLAARASAASRQCNQHVRAVIEYCVTGCEKGVFSWLQTIEADGWDDEMRDFEILDLTELNWEGRESLFTGLLAQRELNLARHVLGSSVPVEIAGLAHINLGPVEPWLDWLLELVDQQDEDNKDARAAYWVGSQLAYLIARSTYPATKSVLLDLLDSGEAKTRWVIANLVLPNVEGLTLSDLSLPSIGFLTTLLETQDFANLFRPHAFTQIATEKFVREELIPLAATSNDTLRRNIEFLSSHVGRRLGLRFTLPSRTAATTGTDASAAK